jgi:hypothetical protein
MVSSKMLSQIPYIRDKGAAFVRLWLGHNLQPNGCIYWLGSHNKDGYAQLAYWSKVPVGSNISVARIVYQLFKGPIPFRMTVDHLCRNKGCINADHLEVVSYSENTRRSWEHCKGEKRNRRRER